MPFIIRHPSWFLPEHCTTDETAYRSRRRFLEALGLGGLAMAVPAWAQRGRSGPPRPHGVVPFPDYGRNPRFADAGRPLTREEVAVSYNNFYEFSLKKDQVRFVAAKFTLDPYILEIDGLVERPLKLGLKEIEKLGLEERVYRFRCVEAWSMTVPWLGVPLAAVLRRAGVKPEAKFVAFKSFYDPNQAPNQRNATYPWPYYEGLRMSEAMNELAFVATGLYGQRLLPQSGTALRIVLPWKYGFKGPKSVVRITLMHKQPPTFWTDASNEYTFEANVNPRVPHPRWSQASERDIGTGERIPTLPYNGYGEQVARLYG